MEFVVDLDQALCLAEPCRALILYGSVARGEQEPGSDIDLLAIVEQRRPNIRCGDIQLACYTVSQLQHLARNGSLFILHLLSDGVPLRDQQDLLNRIRREYCQPVGYDELYRELHGVIAITNVASSAYDEGRSGLHRALVFAARTYIYGEAALTEPCFSVRRLAERGCAIASAVRAVKSGEGGFEEYRMLLELTAEALRTPLGIPYTDLGLLVREADLTSGLVARLLKSIAPGDNNFPYDWLNDESKVSIRRRHSRRRDAT
ncbi:anti-phage Hailong system nucleotidyltransferase HalB [Thiocapsa bogorovii]|uniref:anti-phage Hailong system nucleotidyltransferase HalB n=1 Tax=Thiocapsa bogorovii TaxID=521689 RepID=UPI0038CD180A